MRGGHGQFGRPPKNGARWEVFPVEVHEFDVIRYGWHVEPGSHRLGQWAGGGLTIPAHDPGVEGFCPFAVEGRIDRERIRAFDLSQVVEFGSEPSPGLDRFSTSTADSKEWVQSLRQTWNRQVVLPEVGPVDAIHVLDLLKCSGHAVWLGLSREHPSAHEFDDKPQLRRQSAFRRNALALTPEVAYPNSFCPSSCPSSRGWPD